MKMNDTENETATTTTARAETAAITPVQTVMMTPEQLARVLNVTRRTLSNWSRDKIIPMVKVGRICRFDYEKVKAALKHYEQEAATATTTSSSTR